MIKQSLINFIKHRWRKKCQKTSKHCRQITLILLTLNYILLQKLLGETDSKYLNNKFPLWQPEKLFQNKVVLVETNLKDR